MLDGYTTEHLKIKLFFDNGLSFQHTCFTLDFPLVLMTLIPSCYPTRNVNTVTYCIYNSKHKSTDRLI